MKRTTKYETQKMNDQLKEKCYGKLIWNEIEKNAECLQSITLTRNRLSKCKMSIYCML